DLLDHIDDSVAEYFQINTDWNSEYRSPKLRTRRFSYDQSVFRSGPAELKWSNDGDEAWLGTDLKVYRGGLKAPAAYPRPAGAPRFGGRRRPPEAGPSEAWANPAIFIQVACDVNKLNAPLAALKERLANETAHLDDRLRADLAGLDGRLDDDLAGV